MSCEECGLAYETGVSDGESTPKTLQELRKALAEHGMVAVPKDALEYLEENCHDGYTYQFYLAMIQAAQEEQ